MKKIHYVGGCWRASVNTTNDWDNVTCELCLRHKHIKKIHNIVRPSPTGRYTGERAQLGFSDTRI